MPDPIQGPDRQPACGPLPAVAVTRWRWPAVLRSSWSPGRWLLVSALHRQLPQPAPSGHSLRGKLRLSWAPVRAHLPCLQSLIRCDSRPLCPACHALPCSVPPFPDRCGLSRSAAWAVPAMTFGARVCARSQCRQVRRQGALSPALCVQAALDERIFRSVRHWGWPLEARRVQIGVLLTF